MTLSTSFADMLAGIRYDDLDAATIKGCKNRLMDYLGCLAGGISGPLNAPVLANLRFDEKGESSILGTTLRGDQELAALCNGIAGHTLELDDGDRRAYGHPAVIVFSALLPAAEARHVSGRDFILAAAVGYEAYGRLGRAANPGALRRGFHTTGVAGALAAALAVAKLDGDSQGMLASMGIAGLCASGLCITFRKGGTLKPFTAGRAAANGVLAARLAAMGVTGADDILEGKDGFFQAYSGQQPNEDVLLAPPCKPFAIASSYIKFYPSCRYTHAPIDAALALRQQVNVDDIVEIVITTYPTAIYLAAKSEWPADALSSRFNIGFAVAVALVKGSVNISDFDPAKAAADPRIQQIFKKVRFVENAAYDDPERNVRGAAMEITLLSGQKVNVDVPLPVGEPENPASSSRYGEKFASLSRDVWSEERRGQILACIDDLENLKGISQLISLLTNG